MQKNNTEKGNTMDNSFFSSMDTQPHAFLFAGQSTPWTSTVDEAAQNSRLLEQLRAYDAAAEALLQPAATELLTVYGRRLDLFSYASQSLILGMPGMLRSVCPELYWHSWQPFWTRKNWGCLLLPVHLSGQPAIHRGFCQLIS